MTPRPATVARRGAERRGLRAEALAAWLLRAKGYRILARRYRTPVGEVDLVARRGGIVAFVEVKQRATLAACLEAVTPRQRQRIARAAAQFLARRGETLTARFDLIALAPRRLPRHLADAWRPDDSQAR